MRRVPVAPAALFLPVLGLLTAVTAAAARTVRPGPGAGFAGAGGSPRSVPAVVAAEGRRARLGRALEAAARRSVAAADTDTAVARGDTVPEAAAGRDTLDELPARLDTLLGTLPEEDSLRRVAARAAREQLAGGSFPQRDSIFRRLAELSGFRAIEYRGERVSLEAERRTLHLRGEAQANYGEAALRADSIDYRSRLRFLTARGAINLTSPEQREVRSDSVLYYDVSSRTGTILDARTEFAQRGTTWHVVGDAVPVGDRTVYVSRGNFTSCDLDEPHYYFRAGQIKMVSRDVIVAWPVVLYVSDVPVFWLPFFAQDIRPDRRSGIIPPQFGFNDVVRTSGGFNRQISDFGYYWAINRFMDARLTMSWFSGNYVRLNGRFRYRFLKKFLEGNVNVTRDWGETGRNFNVNFFHDQRLSPDTRLRARGQFIQNTRVFQDRSFEEEEQTQTIDSDVGLTHRFPFADISLSGRRRQFLGEGDRVDLTLPSLNVSFSPVTLFEAPRSRSGLFDNLTWNGSASFSRSSTSDERAPDVTTTRADLRQSLRVSQLTLSGSASLDDRVTTPKDSAGNDLPSEGRTTVNWSTGTNYRFELVGSTALRPSVSVDGAFFRSPDTDDDFVSAPTRVNVGGRLSTDLYGFFPGFGPFDRVRHKISPRFDWRYSPEVSVPPSQRDIPGFPAGAGARRNRLSVDLSQTFEAKIAPDEDESPPSGEESPPRGEEGAEERAEGEERGERPRGGGRQDEARRVVLLGLNTSALEFDFERAAAGEPLLVTDRLRNSITSDLLRGVTVNVTHDLFEGTGADRDFEPFLSQVNASFSIRSGAGLAGIVGLGGEDGRRPGRRPDRRIREGRRATGQIPGEEERERTREGAGPWSLSLSYSLNRSREGEGGRDSQTLRSGLNFRPTPNWDIQWRTSYSFETGEFGSQLVRLERDLHRWRAIFTFQKAPNGNFIFHFRVNLTDAPELKVDYDQRSEPPR